MDERFVADTSFTPLATDYLNHFIEVAMLLELAPDMPEAADLILAWQTRSYEEHFLASRLRNSEEALRLFAAAPERQRARLKAGADAFAALVAEVRAALLDDGQADRAAVLADAAVRAQPIVGALAAVLAGQGEPDDPMPGGAPDPGRTHTLAAP